METEYTDLGTQGQDHGDTQEFDDVELLDGGHNVRLVRIRVWFDDFVYGIQTIYETSNLGMIVSSKRISEDAEAWKLQYEEVSFNRDESIIAIRGHFGNVMDHVVFETNKGRELRFGLSDGGNPFDLEIAPGTCVGALKGGYASHLHNIGCHTIPLAQPLQYQYSYNSESRVENQISAGPTHDDTVEHNDVQFLEGTKGQHRIASVCVFYSEDCVYGLDVKYLESGQEIQTKAVGGSWDRDDHKFKKIVLASDEWITNIYGAFDNFCDLLVFETTKGRTEKFGNTEAEPNFNFEIAEGSVVSGISFGTGGHLHNITAYFGKEPYIHKFTQQPQANVQYSLLQSSTDVVGPTHDDTTAFDDWDKLDPSIINTRLRKVVVYYDEDKTVFGFKLKWSANEEEVEGEKHRGSSYDGWLRDGDKGSFSLKYGQYITRVYGKVANTIKRLCFETNEGETYEYGGDEGEDFDMNIPEGHALGALTGGVNGHLHNLQAWYGKIHTASQSQAQVYYIPSDDRWPHEAFNGNSHDDTTEFSDADIDFNAHSYRIDTVKLYHSKKIKGIQVVYEIDGQYLFGEKHTASFNYNEEEMQTTMINLAVDEFITSISGKLDNVLSQLTVRTSKGREFTAGEGEDGDDFDMDIPEGNCVGVIQGGKNGDIHNIKVHCGPIPQVMTTRW
eukprot:CAMPEP_0205821406 /NCGR_PEP_ID=MMETSP0206-20130828/7467_1 /ASSEMBLY_ACC=CAM_ASM_000279 /TAXON_ID=36767 /ORGANISM="Euplotes focardii, Strain TN1" /LENGTH=671 /DNA_ID=CAMNT_0053116863 /DNA_START=17 /DNA_END=2032 /DNA_ORIENTATION=+